MLSSAKLGVFFVFSLIGHSLSLSSNQNPTTPPLPTVFDILPKFGLPPGLLPDSVVDYTLQDDGRFVVVLSGTCYIQFDYLVYYDKTITGKLGYGSITDLKGIQVQKFFLWFDVDEIKVDLPPSNSIYFLVGLINKKLDIGQFKTIHSCRDDKVSGLGCGSWSPVFQDLCGCFYNINSKVYYTTSSKFSLLIVKRQRWMLEFFSFAADSHG